MEKQTHIHTRQQQISTIKNQINKQTDPFCSIISNQLICMWATDPFWTAGRFNGWRHWHLCRRAWKQTQTPHIPSESLPFSIHTYIISQNLLQPESVKVMLAALDVRWSIPTRRANHLHRREARSRQGHPVRTRDRADLREWHTLIRMPRQVIHVEQVINTCHNVECQALEDSWVALEYWFPHILSIHIVIVSNRGGKRPSRASPKIMEPN